MYVDVIIPLKFKELITYSVPEEMEGKIIPGMIVSVFLQKIRCNAVVLKVTEKPSYDRGRIRPIHEILLLPPVSPENMEFMMQVARYYMCSLNDVFRFAAPSTTKALKKEKTAAEDDLPEIASLPLPALTETQQQALDRIRTYLLQKKTVLLNGVTGSGKTEIYIRLAAQYLSEGKNVLYLVPEMALCRQIQLRLKKVFGARLLVYHSGRTAQKRREVYEKVACGKGPFLILGLRSSLFLPYPGLGAIIVDEEHDSSYKQNEPAPRYNGRDTALMLGRVMDCAVVLGSATPSFETLYNVRTGKFAEVTLKEKYYGEGECRITVVDMPAEKRKHCTKGALSFILTNAIRQRLEKGEQCLVFRSRRAYATMEECSECGYIPRCPHCNIPLAYHKYDRSLRCHLCGWSTGAEEHCPECGKGEMKLYGEGTEKIEEELAAYFPEAKIERFDSDTAKDRKEQGEILKRFSEGKTDILVGTQMISKGFDFAGLTLTAVIRAESLSSLFDFRADEKSLQLLRQLKGRAGRRGNESEMIIQTSRASHPVFRLLKQEEEPAEELLAEREEFGYPPFVRMIRILVKSPERERLSVLAEEVRSDIIQSGITDFTGPVPPPVEKSEDGYLLQFIIRLQRDRSSTALKAALYEKLKHLSGHSCIIDVDPVNI